MSKRRKNVKKALERLDESYELGLPNPNMNGGFGYGVTPIPTNTDAEVIIEKRRFLGTKDIKKKDISRELLYF